MMKKIVLAAALLLSAPAAFADAPGKGQFGLGLNFQPFDAFANVGTTGPVNGIGGSYWVLDPLRLNAQINFLTIENVGDRFSFVGGADYFILKNPVYGAYLGGLLGIGSNSPKGGNSLTSFIMELGGGAEYFVNRHFTVGIFEGVEFITNLPTAIGAAVGAVNTFGFTTQLRLNWYF